MSRAGQIVEQLVKSEESGINQELLTMAREACKNMQGAYARHGFIQEGVASSDGYGVHVVIADQDPSTIYERAQPLVEDLQTRVRKRWTGSELTVEQLEINGQPGYSFVLKR